MKYFVAIFLMLLCFTEVRSQNFDIELLKDINVNRNQALDPSFRFVTNSVTPLVIAVPAFYLTEALIKKDSVSKGRAIIICSSLAISGIISTTLKYAIQRERPFDQYSFIQKETSGGGYSFPSGHTSAAFSLATSISIVYPKWYVIAPSFLWASAVGYSRMDLGVHYPSDVLAGAIIGSGSAFLSYKLNKWIAGKQRLRKL
jgi:membrane-associated phospholipid phosphatase